MEAEFYRNIGRFGDAGCTEQVLVGMSASRPTLSSRFPHAHSEFAYSLMP